MIDIALCTEQCLEQPENKAPLIGPLLAKQRL